MSREERRKPLRLRGWDYGRPGYYFVTVCTREKKCLLGEVVGADVLIGPHLVPSARGGIVDDVLAQMPTVHQYIIMPNHVHIIFEIPDSKESGNGPMETSAPTVPQLVRYFKRVVTQRIGESIWQRSYHDHIIRNEADYLRIWNYIDTNPAKWREDLYYQVP